MNDHNGNREAQRQNIQAGDLAKGEERGTPNRSSPALTNKPNGDKSSRKRKRSSPFRIKTGCLVALRIRSELNNCPISVIEEASDGSSSSLNTIRFDDKFSMVWSKPFPGRDEGLALIGKMIRCSFPGQDGKRSVLEGEIIRLVEYGDHHIRGMKKGFSVELLIASNLSSKFSFLERVDQEADKAEIKSSKSQSPEERIRGVDKVVVKVPLMKPWWMEYQIYTEFSSRKYVSWAILKLVPAKLFHKSHPRSRGKLPGEDASGKGENGKKSAADRPKAAISTNVRYMGDKNDAENQQKANFRWSASRFHDVLLSEWDNTFNTNTFNTFGAETVSTGVAGLVLRVSSRDVDSNTVSTLAMVDVERIFLPEHTAGGRRQEDDLLTVFGDSDCSGPDERKLRLRVPIEHLVIISRKAVSDSTAFGQQQETDDVLSMMNLGAMYSQEKNQYSALTGSVGVLPNNTAAQIDDEEPDTLQNTLSSIMKGKQSSSPTSFFEAVCTKIEKAHLIDFQLPGTLMSKPAFPTPLLNPCTKVKVRMPSKNKRSPGRPPKSSSKDKKQKLDGDKKEQVIKEDYFVFKPTCARMEAYDPNQKRQRNAFEKIESQDNPRCLRESESSNKEGDPEKEEKTLSSRALRANQRQIMRGVASFGANATMNIDTLASREPKVRFDRSGIHAWGVFADEDIAAGEMIIEYRGELIGNSIAEKREKEYEAAKIGSDYMFRIDGVSVCDATKQGNVARFINASCGPNCYTKIITIDSVKRIVIYAKRNINAGEELCYDYKFPLEYDEAKRIPCYCGTKDCRGFMNWNKKYVAIPLDSSSSPGGSTSAPTTVSDKNNATSLSTMDDPSNP